MRKRASERRGESGATQTHSAPRIASRTFYCTSLSFSTRRPASLSLSLMMRASRRKQRTRRARHAQICENKKKARRQLAPSQVDNEIRPTAGHISKIDSLSSLICLRRGHPLSLELTMSRIFLYNNPAQSEAYIMNLFYVPFCLSYNSFTISIFF